MSTIRATDASLDQTVGGSIALRLARGAAGGLAGGVIFGVMMQMMGMIGMIAKLVGSDSVAIGWLVHLGISAALGLGFGLVAGSRLGSWGASLGLGLGYGGVWWVLGGLIAMPLALGMPPFTLDTGAWFSLMGHMVYGAVLGVVAYLLGRRAA